MSTKNLKKRSNSETVEEPKSSDQSPPKKQKKQSIQKPIEKPTVTNGDGIPEGLTAKQRKRLKSKNRKLAAIARIKEAGGIPTPLHAARKEKKLAKENKNPVAEGDVEKDPKRIEAKLKAKQDERAASNKLRQEKRQREGQYKPDQVQLSADEIRIRIAAIKGRPEISKTAKRKLGVLIKKLAVEESTAVATDNENKTQNGGADNSGLSKSEKRRIRREKKGNKVDGGEDVTQENDDGKEKVVDIQVFEKKKTQKTAGNKNAAKDLQKNVNKAAEVKTVEKINKNEMKAGKKQGKAVPKIIEQKIKEEEEDSEDDDDDDDEELEEEEEDEDDDEEAEAEAAEAEEEEEEETEDESEDEEEGSEQEDEEESGDEEEDEEEEKEAEVPKVEIATKKAKNFEGKGKKEQGNQQENSDKKKRYILFVGNMPFTAKVEDVKQHFLTKVSAVSSVRIPTKPGTQTPRGFCYVEVTNDVDYEKGLSLHHTFLNGRRINVEYTTSGSKQVSKRQDLVSKNQKLHALRKAGKLAGSQKHDQKRSVRRFKKREQERTPK